jgi:predicted RNase H-like HicB family nuclease
MKTLEEYVSLPYAVVLIPDEDTKGNPCYRAEHPQLPGCMSHGKTPEEAVRNLSDARRLYLQTRIELGLEIPLPAVYTSGTIYPSTQNFKFVPTAAVVPGIVIKTAVPFKGDVEYRTDFPTSYDAIAKRVAA